MNKIFFTIALLLIAFASQSQDKTIHFEKKSNKPFIVDNKAYFFKERAQIFKNEEALRLLNSARNNMIGTQILGGFAGGFLGFALSDLLLAKRENFTEEQWKNKKTVRTILLGGSVVLLGVSIPILKSSIKKTRKAVELENNSLQDNANNISIKLNTNSNGVGLALNF